MNPLKSVNGTIAAGFILAIIFLLAHGLGSFNLWSTIVMVQGRDDGPSDSSGEQESSSTLGEYKSFLWVGVFTLGLLSILVFMYGPNQIRKIE